MDNLVNGTLIFVAVFALAILVERFIEIIKSVFDLLDSRLGWKKFWDKRALALCDRLTGRLQIHQYMSADAMNRVLASFSRLLLGKEDDYTGTVPSVSGDLIRTLYVKIGTKLLGVAAGIWIAVSFNIDILKIVKVYYPDVTIPFEWGTFNFVITGIILGLGTGPVHKLITTIEHNRRSARKGA